MIKTILIGLVALLHVYFMVLEMFLFTKPYGQRTFGMTPEQAQDRAVLAANMGLYNGFLAAGLIWALLHPNAETGRQISIFFLCCVLIAGLYGAYSAKFDILYIQALPATAALLAVFFL